MSTHARAERVRRVLVARLDNDGDVLLAGPAIRAVKASGAHVTLLHGPRGRRAAELLPGVDVRLCWRAPWIDPEPEPVDPADVETLTGALRAGRFDEAHVLTSFHQSALPLALLLRLAGVRWIGAISEDFPGALLDHRGRDPGDVHEVERALGTVAAAGHALPAGDDGALRVDLGDARSPLDGAGGPYVVVHPGASVPARAPAPETAAAIVAALRDAGHRVVVTGAPAERALTARVAAAGGEDLGGRTSLAELAVVLAGADGVVVGNTGPAHLAAAVGAPVVSLFAPTVPAARWRPWAVPHELLHVPVPCAGCRARACPVPGHPCLDDLPVAAVVAAVERLAGRRAAGHAQPLLEVAS